MTKEEIGELIAALPQGLDADEFIHRLVNWALDRQREEIVRECVRYFNEDYQRDFDNLWREDLSKGIKEHFGVEP
jgi:hypothetical protein